VTFPPFFWASPLGFDHRSSATFWKQPENSRHFFDSLTPISGLVQVFPNAVLDEKIVPNSNMTHYINYKKPITRNEPNPRYDTVMYMAGHEIEFFQHFLDNGVPHISLMHLATDVDPSKVVFALGGWTTETIPSLLLRFGFQKVIPWSRSRISARKLILPKIVPAVHPILTQHFIDGLHLNHNHSGKVILVSRTTGGQTKNNRLVLNQDRLAEMLLRKYGESFVEFRAEQHEIGATIRLFENARMIIGSHGGAMYNALWASKASKVMN
jgi:hypothetical protein